MVIFFSRNNYTFFLSFRDFGWNVFGLSLNRFRQLWKFQFMCPQICFVGKNIVSSVPDFEPKLFGSPPKKSRWFSKLHLVCSGEDFEENYLLFWKRKKIHDFVWFFFVNWSEDLLNQHSKCPEDLLEGIKVSWKTTQSFINFPTWWGSFLDIRQTFSIRLSKLLFMCPEKLFVGKFNSSVPYFERHVHGLLARNRNYSEFFPKLQSACGERVWQKFSRNFFHFFQQGLQTGHWLCGVNFRGKIHFNRTIFIFAAFGRWPNCIYASRGTFCWEIRFWIFFRQFMILSQKFFGFGRISRTFFSIPPPTSPQELLKEWFFSGKIKHLFNILEIWAKPIGCLINFLQQNCQKCILRVQMNT